MAGSAVSLGGWLDQYAEVMLTDLELAAELYFDFRSDGNPAKLMLSLYHAQQAVEKSFKLVAVAMGLLEEKKLKKELGHYPVINTLRLLIEETRNQKNTSGEPKNLGESLYWSKQRQDLIWINNIEEFLNKLDEVLDKVEEFLDNLDKELENLAGFPSNDSCFRKVSWALNLGRNSDENTTNNILKMLEMLEKDPEIGILVQLQFASYWLLLQFILELYEKASPVKEALEKRDPFTSEDLAQAISLIKRQSLQSYLRSLRMLRKSPPKSLKQLALIMPGVIENTRKTKVNPENLYKQLVDTNMGSKVAKPQDTVKVKRKIIVTATILALGIPRMADGKTLLDHILCLDVFSECGRYVEPGKGKTNMDLVAEKQDAAALLVLSAQVWVMLLYAWYNFLKSLEKEAKKS